ncbi:hypothetical protein TB2_017019 [Malus domestica]
METMEGREDLKSILEYLPVVVRSCSLFWPPQVVDALKVLAGGPDQSGVHSGELLFIAISDLRHSLLLSSHPFAPSAPYGYALFFNELMSRGEARKWFGEVVPALANLLLRLPALLEYHYQNAGDLIHGVKTGLRLLDSQEAGIVLLSQELISALLGCSLFCLFPTNKRGARHLPTINCDHLFAALYDSYSEQQENKIRCIIHYFERISCHMPEGFVSFERKVLPLKHDPLSISYPKASFWSKSDIPLCRFEVNSSDSGLIEDQSSGALEVDFANKNIGGGALRKGCVQEEIRFMINPELIASMLFMPSMEDNEAIEIIGAERFSDYTGYASSFRFAGDYVDTRDVDSLRRRKTRIIAIDALCSPGMRQYKQDFLLRETNKAFCGFFQQSKDQHNKRLFREDGCSGVQLHPDVKDSSDICSDNRLGGFLAIALSPGADKEPTRLPSQGLLLPQRLRVEERVQVGTTTMNATALPDVIQVADYHNGSDSDTNIDDDDASAVEFYQPVSAVDSEDDEDQIGNDVVLIHSQLHSNDVTVNQVDGGISSLQLNDDVGRNDRLNKSSDNEAEAKEVEEEVASDSEIIRAFREDENRINAPLTAKNAKRVREAMRGISFAEAPPHWAGLIPENNWMDRLRGLRQSSSRRGIGSEISKQLAAHGVTVILTSRDHSVGPEAAKVFQEGGLNVFRHQLDVLNTASITEFCDWLKENYGGLDILK